MGLFQKLFPGRKATGKMAASFFQTLNAYTPVFTSWNGMIYEQAQVRAAIDALARNTAKLQMTIRGAAKPALQTKLRHGPNEFQTWSQFLYQCRTIYEIDTTLFIVPVFDRFGEISGVYPVTPVNVQVVESGGKVYLRYLFQAGQMQAIELENCCVLTRFQYEREFFGGGNKPLKETMDLIHIQNQGIKEAIKQSASFRFMAQHKLLSDPDDLQKEQTRYTEKHMNSGGGVLLFPNEFGDIKQIDSKPFLVNAAQQKLINQNISEYFGVSEKILQNQAYGDEWAAFYEGAIEPFSIQLSEAMTRMLFTFREQSQGSGVMFTANRLQYMSNADKLSVSAQMLDRGIMSRNDVREIWNLPPIEGGDNYIIRGEYYDASEKLNDTGGLNDGENS